MEIFKLMKDNKQEQVAFYTDKSADLRAILSIHSTALGPALGGIRILKYKTAQDALADLFRLSQVMTFKTAAAGLNLGGGQIVIIDQKGMARSEALFRALGRFIESFKGRFISGGDMGVTSESMEYIAMETKYVTGLPEYNDGRGRQAYNCARGIFIGLLAAAEYRWGKADINDRKLLIQGYGNVGSQLAGFAREKGAQVVVSDIVPERQAAAEQAGFGTVDPGNIFSEKCHIFAPCATGPVFSPETAEKIQCEIVAGSANNQLHEERDDLLLKKRGILYAPDFIINAGASIDAAEEYLGYESYKKGKVDKQIERIHDRLLEILKSADERDITPNQAAVEYACDRITAITRIKGTHLAKGKI